MIISGIQPFTSLDYPQRCAAVVFTPGCTMRCAFCHNPEFVLPEQILKLQNSFIPEASFFSFLTARQGLLDGVVVSGGEPTLAADLVPFVEKIKSLGFLVKLDTNGNRPDVLKKLFSAGLIDYIAMDIKTSIEQYPSLTRGSVRPSSIIESIGLIEDSGLPYEFRTTLIKEVHTPAIINAVSELASEAHTWFLQQFRPETTLDPSFTSYHGFSGDELVSMAQLYTTKTRVVQARV